MQVVVNYKDLSNIDTSKTIRAKEENIMQRVGKYLLDTFIPMDDDEISPFTIDTPNGVVNLSVTKRGTYTKNGSELPSMFVKDENDTLDILKSQEIKKVMMICVNDESNNYKFYQMLPLPNGKMQVKYGRIGGGHFPCRQYVTTNKQFWLRYYEKLTKGYNDFSDMYFDENTVHEDVEIDDDTLSSKLWFLLKSFARQTIRNNLIATKVTKKQYQKCKEIYESLCKKKNVESFNKCLKKLLAISPRKVDNVKDLLADTKEDFNDIILREECLLNAMNVISLERGTNRNTFGNYNIDVLEVNQKEKNEILDLLNDSERNLVRNIYKIVDINKENRFKTYVKNNNITEFRKLWHGSRNENWLSIILNGLQLNPNAIITGKMFGDGIYFANSSTKSFGYTSHVGSYWARGNDDISFMGLYECAYGNPLNVEYAHRYSQKDLIRNNKNCVHAHKGAHLRNDEIIFYSESAMVLRYIIEFE